MDTSVINHGRLAWHILVWRDGSKVAYLKKIKTSELHVRWFYELEQIVTYRYFSFMQGMAYWWLGSAGVCLSWKLALWYIFSIVCLTFFSLCKTACLCISVFEEWVKISPRATTVQNLRILFSRVILAVDHQFMRSFPYHFFSLYIDDLRFCISSINRWMYIGLRTVKILIYSISDLSEHLNVLMSYSFIK